MTQQGQEDVVAQLRDLSRHPRYHGVTWTSSEAAICGAAADEIERLHIENIQLKFACGYPMPSELEAHILPSNPFKCGTCEAKSAELERLRSQGGAPEPTDDMAEAGRDWAQREWKASGDPKGYLDFYRGVYSAMLSAAPQPPEGGMARSDREARQRAAASSAPGSVPTSPVTHASDCALHNAPAMEPGPCDCGAVPTSLAGQGPDGYVLVPKEPTEVMINEAQMALDDQRQYRKGDLRNVRDALRRAIDAAPQPTARGDAPKINITCECRDDSVPVIGTRSLNVIRVEREDDGSFTAVTDYWPMDEHYKAALSAERARVIEQAEQIATDAAINEEIILRDFMGRPDLAGAWQDACNYIAAAIRALGQQDTGGVDHG